MQAQVNIHCQNTWTGSTVRTLSPPGCAAGAQICLLPSGWVLQRVCLFVIVQKNGMKTHKSPAVSADLLKTQLSWVFTLWDGTKTGHIREDGSVAPLQNQNPTTRTVAEARQLEKLKILPEH